MTLEGNFCSKTKAKQQLTDGLFPLQSATQNKQLNVMRDKGFASQSITNSFVFELHYLV